MLAGRPGNEPVPSVVVQGATGHGRLPTGTARCIDGKRRWP